MDRTTMETFLEHFPAQLKDTYESDPERFYFPVERTPVKRSDGDYKRPYPERRFQARNSMIKDLCKELDFNRDTMYLALKISKMLGIPDKYEDPYANAASIVMYIADHYLFMTDRKEISYLSGVPVAKITAYYSRLLNQIDL